MSTFTEYQMKNNGEGIPVLKKKRTYSNSEIQSLNKPENIAALIEQMYDASFLPEEHVWIIAMDGQCHCKGIFEVSFCGMNYSTIDVRSMMIRILLVGGFQFAVVHNHPSKSLNPSAEDTKISEQLKKVGELMQCQLVDSIIVSNGKYFSFSELKMIH